MAVNLDDPKVRLSVRLLGDALSVTAHNPDGSRHAIHVDTRDRAIQLALFRFLSDLAPRLPELRAALDKPTEKADA